MIIRDARPDELPAVGELRLTAYRDGGHLSRASEYAPRLRALGTDGHGDVLVAEADGRLIGTVMLQFPPHAGEIVRGPDEAEIRALAVSPDGQRRGTGRALVEAAIARAVQRGVRHLVLCSMPDMVTAHCLYERAGFCRLPDRDWCPGDETLLVYGLVLPTAADPPDGAATPAVTR